MKNKFIKRITKNINNRNAQSLISVMLFIMALGIIVTLIVAASITDTKRLVSEKSYERAYSLSDDYISKILSNPSQIFGLGTPESLPSIFDSSNTSLQCSNVNLTTISCSNAGSNKDSEVTCSQEPTNYALNLTGVKDKKLNINLAGADAAIKNNNGKLAFMFTSGDALLFNFRYTKSGTPANIIFGVRSTASNTNAYSGMVVIPSNNNPSTINTAILSSYNTGNSIYNLHDVIVDTTDSDITSNGISILDSFNNSLDGDYYPFSLNLNNLATDVGGSNISMSSLTVTFLNQSNTNTKYSIVQIGFDGLPDALANQFQKTSCTALDSAVSGTQLIPGFGAATLESYRPRNKTVAGIFDYALFVGKENNTGDIVPISDGLGTSINK